HRRVRQEEGGARQASSRRSTRGGDGRAAQPTQGAREDQRQCRGARCHLIARAAAEVPIDLSREESARPFRFDGGGVGCLLLHGFTGTPSEMLPIGEALAKRGYAVSAPLLPGHGTRVEDLARTTWEQWFATALDAWTELGQSSPTRVVGGLSM